MPQMNEQEKALEKELNAMETSNLPDIELKKMAIRMLKELMRSTGNIVKTTIA